MKRNTIVFVLFAVTALLIGSVASVTAKGVPPLSAARPAIT